MNKLDTLASIIIIITIALIVFSENNKEYATDVLASIILIILNLIYMICMMFLLIKSGR